MTSAIAPIVFVLLWSTGYIASKLGAPFAEPGTFLAIRFSIVAAVCFAAWPWLRPHVLSLPAWGISVLTGALVHGVYLGTVFWAIANGMPTGVVALVLCLQPILTAVLSGVLLGEHLRLVNWLGLAGGLAGALLVLGPQTLAGTDGFTALTLLACAIGLASITIGTLIQKAYAATIDFRAALLPQYLGACAAVAMWAVFTETREVDWTPTFVLVLAWLVIVLSFGAISFLYIMIERGEVWRAAALFYLIPATTALMGWIGFGETLTPLQIAGMAIVTLSVLVARR